MVELHSYSDVPDLEVADAIGQLAGAISAVQSELFALVAEFDRRQAWREDGAADMASWLRIRLGLGHRTAQDWARVAGDLEALPECSRAFAEGRLSWDQLRPLTQVATPESDPRHAADAPGSHGGLAGGGGAACAAGGAVRDRAPGVEASFALVVPGR